MACYSKIKIAESNICILAFPSAIGLSHLTRLLLIARELRSRGAKIAFAFKEKKILLEQEGFDFFSVLDSTITDFSSNVFAAYTPALVEECVKEELQVIEAVKPDAIVGDFRLTAAISSRLTGVPYISVVNAYMTDYFNPVDVMISQERSVFKHAIASTLGRGIQAVQKRATATPFRTAARKYGIKDLINLYDFLRGDLTLIADLPQFCALESLPDNYRYIGPLIWEGLNCATPEYLEHLNSSKIIIYATTSNTGNERLIKLVSAAFKDDKNYEVIVTTGPFIDTNVVPMASNFHAERFISGSKVMKKAHNAIHCGGNGTTYQALSHGIPSVVMPFNNDQKINAWLIRKHKLGIPLLQSNVTSDHLKLAVTKVFHNSDIRNNLECFKNVLKDINGPKSAADQILAFLKEKPEVRP